MGWPWAQVVWLNARGRANRFSTLKDANRTVIAYLPNPSKRTRSYLPPGQNNMRTAQSRCYLGPHLIQLATGRHGSDWRGA
jgi:hypothetical protein